MQYSSSLFEFEGASSMVAKLFKRPAPKGRATTVTLTSEEAEVLRLVLDDYILTREQRPVFTSVAAKLRCAPKALPKPR
jgi:hypothetical protein